MNGALDKHFPWLEKGATYDVVSERHGARRVILCCFLFRAGFALALCRDAANRKKQLTIRVKHTQWAKVDPASSPPA